MRDKLNKELWDTTFSKEDVQKFIGGFPKMSDLLGKNPDLHYIQNLESQLASTRSRIEELEGALGDVIGEIDVPDAICSCHIAPPCSDCVEYSHLRDLVKIARQALSDKSEPVKKEVSVEELKNELRRLFNNFEVGDGKTFGFNYIAHRLSTKYTIKEKV